MTHTASHIIISSLLGIFDPFNEEYVGVRGHFSKQELEKIDEFRARDPETAHFSLSDKGFVSYVLSKAIFLGD